MALNLSRDSIFPVEEKFFSGIKISNLEFDSSYDHRVENTDIIDLLPSDPFGMDVSATVTTITGWIENIEKDFGFNNLGLNTDEVGVKRGNDRLLAGLNFVWNGSFMFHPELDDINTYGNGIGSAREEEFWYELFDDSSLLSDDKTEDFLGFSYEKYLLSSNDAIKEPQVCNRSHCEDDGGAPPDAFFFALGYLGVRDLLSVERVCKPLRDSVQNDPLLWRNIHIDRPLSGKITDDALLRLSSRAQGSLEGLNLIECLNITDAGLWRVLESNHALTKLSVPGCVRLSVEGILRNLRIFKSPGKPGITHLRIGGLFGVTLTHFEEFMSLLGVDKCKQSGTLKPRFYCGSQLYLSLDDDRAIDIEKCPRCLQLRQVYDCPSASCQGQHQAVPLCRGCTICIARCIGCGRCINGCDYEETFCLDLLCLDCWKQLLNCQEKQEGFGVPAKCTVLHQQARYHLCLQG